MTGTESQKVSIIVPVYMVEKYIGRCIQSILDQTYKNIEVLLVDDGSKDSSGAICDRYADQDARIQVFHLKNSGVAAARNSGLKFSTGKYVTFVDADDYIDRDYIKIMIKSIEQNNNDCVMVGHKELFENGMVTSTMKADAVEVHLNRDELIKTLCYSPVVLENCDITSVWGKLYKKAVLEGITFNEGMILGEDFDFNLRVYSKSDSAVVLPVDNYYYLIREGSTMRKKNPSGLLQTQDEIEKIADKMIDNGYHSAVLAKCVNMSITMFMLTTKGGDIENVRTRIRLFIKNNRKRVLADKNIKRKLRIALTFSCFGLNFTQKIYSLVAK